jgi:O-antigen ligase
MAAVIGIVAATALWPRGEGGAVTGGGAWTHREAATTWLAALLAGAVLGTVLPSPLGWQSSLETSVRRVVEFDQGSGRGRLVQYATTFAMARANPMFGVGPGNWTVEYPRFARRGDPNLLPGPVSAPRLPLNDWLGTLSEVGAPVLIAVAVLAILVSLPATAAIVRGYRTGRVHTADVALLALLVEVVLLGSLDAVMQSPLGPMVTALLVAVLARRWLTLRVRSGSPRVGWGGAAAMVAGSLFLTALAGRRLSAAVQYGDDATLAAFRAAAAIDPSDFTAQFFAGVAYTRRGDCRSAAPYLRAARVLLPYAESVRVVGRVCASRSRAP